MNSLGRIFGIAKPVITMLHLPGLPGRPWHDVAGGTDAIVDSLRHDLAILQEAGVDGVLFCNEKDIPYQLEVGPEIVAGMASAVGQLRADIRVPFGVNLLWDAIASLAVARATGASFVREVMTGVYESDLGMIQPKIGEIAGFRTRIGAQDVALFDNIMPEFSSAIGSRTVADRARGAAFLGVDAILVSGPAAGVQMSMDDLRAAKEAVTGAGYDVPIIANTGVRAEKVEAILGVADGCILGTSLKVDGHIWNPVDRERAMRFMDAVRAVRARPASA
jgi:uncharacterized protein